jgi:hydrogenase maturation protease
MGGAASQRETDWVAVDRSTPPVTVVGCGNWQVRTDRVGPRVLAALASKGAPDVITQDVGVSILGLLDLLRGQELLVLADACVGLATPGTILVREPDPEAPLTATSSVHQIGPLETLAVARELYPERLPLRTVLVLIETGGLEAEAEAETCRRAVEVIEEQIEGWRAASRSAQDRKGAGTRR